MPTESVQAPSQDAMRESLGLLQAVTDNATEGLFIKDSHGRYLYCNPAGARFTRRPVAEILGRDDASLFGDEAARIIRTQDLRVMATGVTETEIHELDASGAPRIYEVTKWPHRDPQGRVIGVGGEARDITAKMQALAAARRQQAIFEQIARGVPLNNILHDLVTLVEDEVPGVLGSFLMLDPATNTLHIAAAQSLPATYNAAIEGVAIGPCVGSCGTAAYRRERVLVADIDSDPLWADYHELALAHGLRACWSIPLRSRKAPGNPVLGTFAIYARQPGLPDPRLEPLIARIEDLACIAIEQHRAIQSLQASETRFRTLVENTADAIFLHDSVGRVIDVNQRACEHLGYARDELLGMMPFAFDPVVTPEMLEMLLAAMDRGERPVFETQHRRKDGTLFPVEVRLGPFHQGGTRLSIATAHDISSRKRAENLLRESNRQLSSIYETVADIVFLLAVERDGYRFQSVNPAFALCTGLPLEAIVGKPIEEVIPEPSLSRVRQYYRRAADEKRIVRWEETSKYPRGTLVGEVSVAPVFGDDGVCTHLVGSVHDITARKRAEDAQRISERRLAEAQTNARIGSWGWVPDTDSAWCSDEIFSLYGVDPLVAQPSFKAFMEFLHPDDHARNLEQIDAFQQGADQLAIDFRIIRPDGATLWLSRLSRAVRNSAGKLLRVEGTDQDITERKRAEQALDENRRFCSAIIQATPECIKVVDQSGRVIEMNAAGLELMEADAPEQVIGNCVFDMVAPEDLAAYLDFHERVSRGESSRLKFDVIGYKGTRRTMESHAVPVDFQGRRVHLAVARDVTQRDRAEAAFRESESRMRLVFEHMPVMLNAFDEEGRLVLWNTECERVTGYAAAELVGHPRALEILYPDREYRTRMLQEWEHRGNDFYRWEWNLTCKDGSVRTVAWSNITGRIPVPGWRTWSVGLDITEQKRQESERRLCEFALNRASVAAYLIAPNARILRVNRANCDMLGYSEDELTGMTVHDVNPEFPSAVWPDHWRELQTKRHMQFESVVRHKAGRTIPVEIEVNYLEFEGREYNFAFVRDITERKRAEDALRESESRLRIALQAAGGVAFVWDVPNDAIVRYYSAESALPANLNRPESLAEVRARAHPDDQAVYDAGIAACLAHGNEYRNLYRVLRPDGSILWLEARGNLERSADGTPLRLTGIAMDVTERKQAEAELRRTTELLKAVADGTTDAVFVKDRDGRYLLFNAAASRFVGKPIDEVLGRDDTEVFEPESGRQLLARDRQVMTEAKVQTYEETLTAAGVTRTFLSTKGPFWNDAGEVAGLIGIARDISDRKQAELAIQASERDFADFFENATVGIHMVGPDGTILRANRAELQMLGYSLEEYVGHNIAKYHETTDEVGEVLRRLKAREALKSYPARMVCKDGSVRDVMIDSSVRWEGGRFVSTRCFTRDVTEMKRLEEQVRQAQKMEAIGRLAGGVAHDFNNLLTIINGYSEMLLAETPPGNLRHECLTAVRDAGERAAGLTAQLLAFSRRAIVEPQVLDLNEVVESAARLLRRLIGANITLAVVTHPALRTIKADPGQIEQVIMNLVVNARDAMPTGGRLTLETSNVVVEEPAGQLRPGHHVCLRVKDTGQGMTDEVKSRMFEPFFTTKPVGKGTGLGLAVVHGIVQQSGGTVEVETTVGHGTTFKLLFPAVAVSAKAAPSPTVTKTSQGTETLLLVEDEDAVRTITKIALENAGYKVLAANGAAMALRHMAGHPTPVHLLVTDIVMPEMGGHQLAELLRTHRPGLPVLFMSGHIDDVNIQDQLRSSSAFLQKPFTPASLTGKVREVLDSAAR